MGTTLLGPVMRVFALLSCLIVTACADIPELDNSISPEGLAAPNPHILPLDPIATQANEAVVTDETTAQLQARAAALKLRAARIRAGG